MSAADNGTGPRPVRQVSTRMLFVSTQSRGRAVEKISKLADSIDMRMSGEQKAMNEYKNTEESIRKYESTSDGEGNSFVGGRALTFAFSCFRCLHCCLCVAGKMSCLLLFIILCRMMLCYVMLCHVRTCHVMLYMLCRVMLCHVVSR